LPYAYYTKLSQAERAVYRASDRVQAVPLAQPGKLAPSIDAIHDALARAARLNLQRAVQSLTDGTVMDLGTAPVRVRVLAARPEYGWGELHGEYTPRDGRHRALIRVWMRTARHKRVVAYKTFLRTVLHELCHHLDYELFKFPDSLHTEGFFKRESSLFKQLTRHAQPTAANERTGSLSSSALR